MVQRNFKEEFPAATDIVPFIVFTNRNFSRFNRFNMFQIQPKYEFGEMVDETSFGESFI